MWCDGREAVEDAPDASAHQHLMENEQSESMFMNDRRITIREVFLRFRETIRKIFLLVLGQKQNDNDAPAYILQKLLRLTFNYF